MEGPLECRDAGGFLNWGYIPVNRPGKEDHIVPTQVHLCKLLGSVCWSDESRYGDREGFADMETLHRQVHELATELLDIRDRGSAQAASAAMEKLHQLRDSLLRELKGLLRQN